MNIKTKLLSRYLLIALLTLVIGFFCIQLINDIELRYSKVAEETFPMIESLKDLKFASLRLVSSTTEGALVSKITKSIEDNDSLETEKDLIQSGIKKYDSSLAHYARHMKLYPDEQYLFDAIKENGELLKATSIEIMGAIKNGGSDSAIYELKEKFEEYEMGTLKAIDTAVAYEEDEIAERMESVEFIITNSVYIILFACGLSFLVAIVLGFVSAESISRPIRKLYSAMEKAGKGDLTVKTEIQSNDEIGELSSTFNNMTDDLMKYKEFSKIHEDQLTSKNQELTQEIDNRKKAEEQLERMAYYDELTNLPNRANFLAYLQRMLNRMKWRSDYLFAVLFIDLDRFKVVNDSLGHLIGDKLLYEVACRLDECVRPTDRISRVAGNDRVARFGGDEFALFLNDVKDISSASRVADRIHATLQKSFVIDGHELFTSASIGIALSASDYKNAEDILRDADSAMYRAKALGKSCSVIFDQDMHVRVMEMLQLESDLRTAVDRQEFMAYYQPIVSATEGRIVGAEALMRWKHPEKGFISPMDFIPVAEETGLISTMGEWILGEACAQNRAWQDAGYENLLMKVNFSSRQFKDDNLAEVVKKVIRETGISSQLLDVEITESIAMEPCSIKILNQLSAMGLQTSIDDFGTGFSSLGSITKFPINTIKIDRAFIKDINVDVNADAIIKAIIAMAHSLNMEVVAEGVETEDQLVFLQALKCDKIQGYLFSPPVPEEEFSKLLEKDKNGSPLIQMYAKATA